MKKAREIVAGRVTSVEAQASSSSTSAVGG